MESDISLIYSLLLDQHHRKAIYYSTLLSLPNLKNFLSNKESITAVIPTFFSLVRPTAIGIIHNEKREIGFYFPFYEHIFVVVVEKYIKQKAKIKK